jgi:hypothetical protein
MIEDEAKTDFVPILPYVKSILYIWIGIASAPVAMLFFGRPYYTWGAYAVEALAYALFIDVAFRQSAWSSLEPPLVSRTVWRRFVLVAICQFAAVAVVLGLAVFGQVIIILLLAPVLFPALVMLAGERLAILGGQMVVKTLNGPGERAMAAVFVVGGIYIATSAIKALISFLVLGSLLLFSVEGPDVMRWLMELGQPWLIIIRAVSAYLDGFVSLIPYAVLALILRWCFVLPGDVLARASHA